LYHTLIQLQKLKIYIARYDMATDVESLWETLTDERIKHLLNYFY